MEYVDQNNALIDKQYKSIYDGKWSVKNPLNAKDNSHKIPKKNGKIQKSPNFPKILKIPKIPKFQKSQKKKTNWFRAVCIP